MKQGWSYQNEQKACLDISKSMFIFIFRTDKENQNTS